MSVTPRNRDNRIARDRLTSPSVGDENFRRTCPRCGWPCTHIHPVYWDSEWNAYGGMCGQCAQEATATFDIRGWPPAKPAEPVTEPQPVVAAFLQEAGIGPVEYRGALGLEPADPIIAEIAGEMGVTLAPEDPIVAEIAEAMTHAVDPDAPIPPGLVIEPPTPDVAAPPAEVIESQPQPEVEVAEPEVPFEEPVVRRRVKRVYGKIVEAGQDFTIGEVYEWLDVTYYEHHVPMPTDTAKVREVIADVHLDAVADGQVEVVGRRPDPLDAEKTLTVFRKAD